MEQMLLPLALAALLIFFLFNSRRKQKARMEQIKTGLVPGAKVMTTFGVFGTVLSIDEDENQVTIESGPGTTLRVHRQAIGQIENPEAPADVAPMGDVDATDNDDENPAITDAELDAMNERKRAESDDTALDADAEVPAQTGDVRADEAQADDIESIAQADADASPDADVAEQSTPTDVDDATVGTDSTAAADTADATGAEDSSKGLGTETPDSDEKKN